MTNKEVINFLNQVRKILLDDKSWLESTIQPINEAFDMAINALTAQPDSKESSFTRKELDTISRQAVIDALDKEYRCTDRSDDWDGLKTAMLIIENLPSAQSTMGQQNDGDTISRRMAIDAMANTLWHYPNECYRNLNKYEFAKGLAELGLKSVPSAQPDIKQAAKLLSDFIESCPGGDSYLITPNGEELRTDWGYATEGIQLIHDWAERRTDER